MKPLTTGNRIKVLRETHNLNRMDLGRILGVSVATVERWENNRQALKRDSLLKVAEAFGVSAEWLLNGIEPPKAVTVTNKAEPSVKTAEPKATAPVPEQHDRLAARVNRLSPTRLGRLLGYLTALVGEEMGKGAEL